MPSRVMDLQGMPITGRGGVRRNGSGEMRRHACCGYNDPEAVFLCRAGKAMASSGVLCAE